MHAQAYHELGLLLMYSKAAVKQTQVEAHRMLQVALKMKPQREDYRADESRCRGHLTAIEERGARRAAEKSREDDEDDEDDDED